MSLLVGSHLLIPVCQLLDLQLLFLLLFLLFGILLLVALAVFTGGLDETVVDGSLRVAGLGALPCLLGGLIGVG